jgi:nitric oxide reductase NorD protein
MAEPEDVILEAAHAATGVVAGLWRRNRAGPPLLHLVDVRQRLELLAGAVYADPPPIVVAEPPARPSFIRRIAQRIPRHLLDTRPLPGTDGARIRLPRSLDARDEVGARAQYRLWAVEQAARAARGTPTVLARLVDPLERALFLISEAAAVDGAIVRELPGLACDLAAARRAALADRPDDSRLTPQERAVEALLRAVLESNPAILPASLSAAASAEESASWATREADRIRALPGRFRGVRAVPLWGRTESAFEPKPPVSGGVRNAPDPAPLETRVRTLLRRPRVRHAPEGEDDENVGMWMIQIDDPQQHAEDPMGLQRPSDTDTDLDPDALADSVSELPEARLVPAPGSPSEVLSSEDPPERSVRLEEVPRIAGIAYPEWDYRTDEYHAARAIVREHVARAGDAAWAARVLRERAQEIQQVRRRFERLRPQRVRFRRQPDGPEIDVGAYVTLHADLRAGCVADDRLYEDVRPARRGVAIALLVDVSGSTDSWVSGARRIIDVEKEALLLVCEALDALGDRYTVLGFSGEGPGQVVIQTVKSFEERNGPTVRRRIAGLEPDRYTRFGAAIRHATAGLCRESAQHRLLLAISDGKPNDVDIYEGRYGVEDTRQAVAEARLQGLHPFCLTVDRQAPVYMPRLFGPGGYAVLQDAEKLPQVLVEVVRRLVRD